MRWAQVDSLQPYSDIITNICEADKTDTNLQETVHFELYLGQDYIVVDKI
jgi:hypothetical protein